MNERVKRRKLFLVTDGFPVRKFSEGTFVIPELRALINDYDVSIIACCNSSEGVVQEFQEEFGDRVKVYHYQPPQGQYLQEARMFLRALLTDFFRKEVVKIVKNHAGIIKKLLWTFLFFYWANDFCQWVENSDLEIEDDAICYTFWHQYYLLAFVMLKKKVSKFKIVSRIHGYDLFEDQSPMKWQPFKLFMDENTDKTIFISEQGKQYYEEQYFAKENARNHIVCRLGVMPQNMQICTKRDKFLLVSCSNLYPLKNIDMIILALSLLEDAEIEWVHFGQGEEKEKLERLAKELLEPMKNIKYEFKGFVTNEQILNYYGESRPSCFITTSLTEGSPVSMQEALACGIPLIGTDVGGIYEMIEGNGYLLSKEPTPEETADAICKIYNLSETEHYAMSKKSLEIWSEKFDREKNNKQFLSILSQL